MSNLLKPGVTPGFGLEALLCGFSLLLAVSGMDGWIQCGLQPKGPDIAVLGSGLL